MVHRLLAAMYRAARDQDAADAAAAKAARLQAAAADADAAAVQGPVAAQPARAPAQPLPVQQTASASGGGPAAKAFQGEPLRIHVALADEAGPGATTGQASSRGTVHRTVSVPGEERASKAASEPPTRALPVKGSPAGSSVKGTRPEWMLRADERGGSSLQHPASCMTALLHARC